MAEIIRMPRLSDTMEEGVIVEWHKQVGDKVSPGDILAEVETDKATMDLESFQSGTLLYIGVESGAVPVDGIIAVIGDQGEDFKSLLEASQQSSGNGSQPPSTEETKTRPKPKPEQPLQVETTQGSSSDSSRLKSSPLARKMAAESGIDLHSLAGSGQGGRIIKRDIEQALSSPLTTKTTISLESKEVPVSQMRKTIARRLAESKFSAPHFYLTMEIDMDEAISARKAINNSIEPAKISFNDLVVKAAAMALRSHTQVNASWQGDTVIYHGDIHVGVAVAVEEGLLVPVINHTDKKSLQEINAEVKEKAAKAKEKKLSLEEMQGNTFTISNLGMFGIEEFTAIINPPDACILAVGGISQRPVVKNGEISVGNRMKVTLSCDHRVVDGATGARFLQTFRNLLEAPVRMLA